VISTPVQPEDLENDRMNPRENRENDDL